MEGYYSKKEVMELLGRYKESYERRVILAAKRNQNALDIAENGLALVNEITDGIRLIKTVYPKYSNEKTQEAKNEQVQSRR